MIYISTVAHTVPQIDGTLNTYIFECILNMRYGQLTRLYRKRGYTFPDPGRKVPSRGDLFDYNSKGCRDPTELSELPEGLGGAHARQHNRQYFLICRYRFERFLVKEGKKERRKEGKKERREGKEGKEGKEGGK